MREGAKRKILLNAAALLAAFLIASPGASAAAVRVAIVPVGEPAALSTPHPALTAAEAGLSDDEAVLLLDRQEVEAALGEQRLAQQWAGADAAMQAGKVLRAELFAAVEVAGEPHVPVGLVVFDAVSGARLVDAALPVEPEACAAAIVAHVRDAATSRARADAASHTLAMLPPRNVDLGREADALAEATARLLAQRLLATGGLAVLERDRLAIVNDEARLPADTPPAQLGSAAVSLQLELARGRAGGVEAAAIVTRGNEKPERLTAQHDSLQPAALADALAPQIERLLAIDAPPSAPRDAAAEAARFHWESVLAKRHERLDVAQIAGEAALALDPTFEHAEHLADVLSDRARVVTRKAVTVDRINSEEDALWAMDLSHRAARVAMEGAALLRGRADEASQMHDIAGVTAFKLNDVIDDLRSASDGSPALRQRQPELHLARMELSRLAIGAAEQGIDPEDEARNVYEWGHEISLLVNGLIHDGYRPDRAEAIAGTTERWLPHAERVGVHALWAPTELLESVALPWAGWAREPVWHPSEGPRLNRLWARMRASSDEAVRAYALMGQLQTDIDVLSLRGEAVAQRRTEARLAIQSEIERVPDGPRAGRRKGILYQVASMALRLGRGDDRGADGQALVAFMLSRDEIAEVGAKLAAPGPTPRTVEDARRRLAEIDQLIADLDGGRFSPAFEREDDGPAQLRREWVRHRMALLAEHPELTGSNPPPWRDAATLFDIVDHTQGLERIFEPVVHDEHVLLLALDESPKDDDHLQLFRVPLGGGPEQPLGRLAVHHPFPRTEARYRGAAPQVGTTQGNGSLRTVSCAAVGDGVFYAGVRDRGVVAFPLDGSPPRPIEGLPGTEVQAMTFLPAGDGAPGGKLFVALGGSTLVTYDPASGSITTLASSARVEPTNPWEGRGPFAVSMLHADPAGDRVLAFVYVRPNINRHDRSGLWSVSREGRFEQLINCMLTGPTAPWARVDADDRVLAAIDFGWFAYDVKADAAEVIYGRLDGYMNGTVEGAAVPKIDPAKGERLPPTLDGTLQLDPPFLVRGDWLWCANPFARHHRETGEEQRFPSPRAGGKAFAPLVALQAIDADRILAADAYGVFLLHVEPDAER